MDLVFHDPSDIPLPPHEVRIRDLRAEPHPDGRRVRVFLELTPFTQRPSGELVLQDFSGNELANVSIVEAFIPKMELTMHMRGENLKPPYHLSATIYYQAEEKEGENISGGPARQVVDEKQITFEGRDI
jgi:hypothetical protein